MAHSLRQFSLWYGLVGISQSVIAGIQMKVDYEEKVTTGVGIAFKGHPPKGYTSANCVPPLKSLIAF